MKHKNMLHTGEGWEEVLMAKKNKKRKQGITLDHLLAFSSLCNVRKCWSISFFQGYQCCVEKVGTLASAIFLIIVHLPPLGVSKVSVHCQLES